MALSLSPLILETAPAEPCSENLTVPIRTSLVIFFPLESIQRGQISWIWRARWLPTHVRPRLGDLIVKCEISTEAAIVHHVDKAASDMRSENRVATTCDAVVVFGPAI